MTAYVTARNACQCEHTDCHHRDRDVAAGKRRAIMIGRVCDRCADTHMSDYLTRGER